MKQIIKTEYSDNRSYAKYSFCKEYYYNRRHYIVIYAYNNFSDQFQCCSECYKKHVRPLMLRCMNIFTKEKGIRISR